MKGIRAFVGVLGQQKWDQAAGENSTACSTGTGHLENGRIIT